LQVFPNPVKNQATIALEIALLIYPNPVKNLSTIHFTLQKPGNTTLQLIDGLGRKVQTRQLGELTPCKYEILCETSGLPKGLFVFTLAVDGEVIGRVKVLVGE